VGLDNINDYYDINLKFGRLKELGFHQEDIHWNRPLQSSKYHDRCTFIRLNLEDKQELNELFQEHRFDLVVNLAAQAGVRYSLENPSAYVESNVVGFLNILEASRHFGVKKLMYASSSSVYGLNDKIPFSVHDNVDNPISLYAATKKSNELMAHTYSHLFGIQSIGLRFFSVYGPWGRPDMAMFLFTEAILNNRPIQVFNEGNLSRDFTYIDDIVRGMLNITKAFEQNKVTKKYSLYNIGNNQPIKLLDFIKTIERVTGKSAQKIMLPMQPGDVESTWADTLELENEFDYRPETNIQTGIQSFVDWYTNFYQIQN
ncbi:MAG: NAD-dependent epimerase/dehydratase family protein, partial [Flavobacterium sp.]